MTGMRERLARIEVKIGALIVGTAVADRVLGWLLGGT